MSISDEPSTLKCVSSSSSSSYKSDSFKDIQNSFPSTSVLSTLTFPSSNGSSSPDSARIVAATSPASTTEAPALAIVNKEERTPSPASSSSAGSVFRCESRASSSNDGEMFRVTQLFGLDTLQATYMDVAVLRCLFMRHWSEEGIFWGLNYFCKRLSAIYSKMSVTIGSTSFILMNGDLNLEMILRSVTDVSNQPISFRVCEALLLVIDLLMNMRILNKTCESSESAKNVRQNCVTLEMAAKLQQKQAANASSCLTGGIEAKESETQVKRENEQFNWILNAVVRIFIILGCQEGCSEEVHSVQSDLLRSKLRNCLIKLEKFNKRLFVNGLNDFVENHEITKLVDFVHALTGYCAFANQAKSNSRAMQETKIKNGKTTKPTYKNRFMESEKGIEGSVIAVIMKPLISKLACHLDDLKQPENMVVCFAVALTSNSIC
ncbi:unnamed protein product [Soboliphyme baturini]|uniref:Uncharacterized protein n=1 Tax=Soboliphyme baturini TaxID=241478 RepID=A0A3P8D5V5_9BILA|nr:unnamed protein product [Soboliphyme baturini]